MKLDTVSFIPHTQKNHIIKGKLFILKWEGLFLKTQEKDKNNF